MFFVDGQAKVGVESASNYQTYGVRPVVYLKSSIQILSGDGSEQNPYVLSGN